MTSTRLDDVGPLLTVSEVAAALRVSRMTIYRLIEAKRLAAIRVGHTFRIPEPALKRYLDAEETPTAP